MQMKTRRNVLALLASGTLVGCSSPAIVSRDANDPFEGGIGGTGIVGVITGFGSILINGLKVEVTNSTKVRSALGDSGLDALSPGQSVTIEAVRTEAGLRARKVTQDHLLVGTLTHGSDGLAVNGVPVRRETGSLGNASVGARVTVNGVWRGDGVVASRIDAAPDGPDIISGTIAYDDHGALSIGAAGVALNGLKAAADGRYSVAIGRAKDGVFEAQALRQERFAGFSSLKQIAAEGYLEPSDTAPGFRIAGLGHSFAKDTRLGAINQRRAVYFGKYDGLFGANRGYVMPDSFLERRRLLQTGLDDGFGGELLRL
jgi:hypothetical protein